MDRYHVYFKEGGNDYVKMPVLFATCNVNFRFAGVGLKNIQIIIDDKRSGANHHIYYIPQKYKLSNLGESIYISRQRMADIITKNDEVIWSRFEKDEREQDIINHYLRVSKERQ